MFWVTHWQNVFLKMALKIVVFWKFCKTYRIINMTEFTINPFMTDADIKWTNQWTRFYMISASVMKELRKLQYLQSSLFWTKHFAKNSFLGISCQIWFQYGIVSFDYSNFDIDNYRFFSSNETVAGKNVRQQLKPCCLHPLTSTASMSKALIASHTVNIWRKS